MQQNPSTQTPPYHLFTLKNGDQIALLGTAHVSQKSVQDVEISSEHFLPDCMCIELDDRRFANLKDQDGWKKINLFTAFRQGQGFLLFANLILSNYQRRMGEELGVKPGAEMLKAIQMAEKSNIPIAVCDRDITTTLKRAWRGCGFWARLKLLSALLASGLGNEKLTEEELTRLKQGDALSEMLETLAKEAPVIKKVLIDERDLYLAKKIYTSTGKRKLAVLGAGHLQGVISALKTLDDGMDIPIEDLKKIPSKTATAHLETFLIPVILIGLFVLLTQRTDSIEAGKMLAKEWLFWNVLMGGLGAAIALANPLIILISALVSPFSSLIPLINAGTITVLVQLWLEKPKIEDFEGLSALEGVRAWYRNRISHALIIWMGSSLGSSLGALIALGRVSFLTS
ncbi:MAG: TraB/GumN family protein [Spirochaetia bacterium]